MAEAPLGQILWPGVEQIEGGSFALTQGITPSICTIEILPQDPSTIPVDGALSILFGDVVIDFFNCRVDVASFEYTQQGQVWRLSILDRRWKWRFAGFNGPVSGWWNQRFPAVQPPPQDWQLGAVQLGSLDVETIKLPQELAAFLLGAMGETAFDVSQMPNTAYPEVQWDNDNPSELLHSLCEQFGCRVCLGIDDVVRVCKVGFGADLPTNGVEFMSNVIEPPKIPDSIMVVGGKSRYQVDFLLEAVGTDIDGTIKPIDKLSYTPAVGWGQTFDLDSERGFNGIAGWNEEDVVPPLTPPVLVKFFRVGAIAPQVNPRYLARQSVYRWYRIRMDKSIDGQNKPPLIPGWRGDPGKHIQALWQILPIEDKQVFGWYDNQNNFVPYDALAYGRYQWWTFATAAAEPDEVSNQDALGNFIKNTPVVFGWSIDRERGIVMFDEPVILQTLAAGKYTNAPANLVLRCAVHVLDFDTQAPDRYTRTRTLSDNIGLGTGGHLTGPRIIKREEIVRTGVPKYKADFTVGGVFTTDATNDFEAEQAIDAAILEYQLKNPQDATYMGIIPISTDGAITQVTWSVGSSGATTRAARNTEINYAIPTFRERAQATLARSQGQIVQQLQNQARRG